MPEISAASALWDSSQSSCRCPTAAGEPSRPEAVYSLPRSARGGRVAPPDTPVPTPKARLLLQALDGVRLRPRPRGRDLPGAARELAEAIRRAVDSRKRHGGEPRERSAVDSVRSRERRRVVDRPRRVELAVRARGTPPTNAWLGLCGRASASWVPRPRESTCPVPRGPAARQWNAIAPCGACCETDSLPSTAAQTSH